MVTLRSLLCALLGSLLTMGAAGTMSCAGPPSEGDAGEGEGEGEGEGDAGLGDVGDTCTFNDDCATALRCGCADGLCACEEGPRGTGVNGVDLCLDGNDCSSAVCAEDAKSTFTCSGPCDHDTDCQARLPVCADIAFLGRICIRQPGP